MSAEEYNRQHAEIRAMESGAVEKAIKLGGELRGEKVKRLGQWQSWVKTHLAFSVDTADDYISLWEHRSLVKDCKHIRQGKRRISEHRVNKKRQERAREGERIEVPNWCQFHQTDFRNLPQFVSARSADVVLADPPWDAGHVGDFAAVDEVAFTLLKPGGSALVYYPRQLLPEVVASFTRLRFALELFTVFTAPIPTWALDGTMIRTRPVLWYYKGPLAKGCKLPNCPTLSDTTFPKPGNDKEWHPWAQSSEALATWLGKLTVPGATVVDCHVGGGSVAAAVKALGNRNYVGSDIDPEAINRTRYRIHDTERRSVL